MESIRDLLEKLGFDPRKSLGQSFCIDKRLPEAVLEALHPEPTETIWEIGPGLGALTRQLAKTGNELWAFEMDRRLEQVLPNVLAPFPRAHLVWGDFLKVDHSPCAPLSPGTLVVCGNLPYSSGTAMVRLLLERPPVPVSRAVFLLQREVTRKACAKPGSDDYSFLSVAVGLFARAKVGATFSPSSFFPNPQVWSSLLLLEPHLLTAAERETRHQALQLASTVFEQRRKMAVNLLRKRFPRVLHPWESVFAQNGIAEGARAETIAPETFLNLTANLPPAE